MLRLERKGGKRATAPLSPPVVRALETYAGERTTGPLFITSTGRRLDRTAAWRLVRRLARAAAIAAAEHISPHSARHAFGTGALDAGVPLRDVQDAMGHAEVKPPRAGTTTGTPRCSRRDRGSERGGERSPSSSRSSSGWVKSSHRARLAGPA